MTSRNHKRISDIFLKACELDLEEREAYLDEACAGNSRLRDEIESLLHHDAEDLLKTGEGAARAASLLASGDASPAPRQDGAAGVRDRCSDCGKPIPIGFDDCPACRTATAGADEETLQIPGHTILRLLGKGGMG